MRVNIKLHGLLRKPISSVNGKLVFLESSAQDCAGSTGRRSHVLCLKDPMLALVLGTVALAAGADDHRVVENPAQARGRWGGSARVFKLTDRSRYLARSRTYESGSYLELWVSPWAVSAAPDRASLIEASANTPRP